MATRPSALPRWASALGVPSPSAYVSEPSAPKKTTGLAPFDTIPNGWLDWLFYTIYAWLYFVDTAVDITIPMSPDGSVCGDWARPLVVDTTMGVKCSLVGGGACAGRKIVPLPVNPEASATQPSTVSMTIGYRKLAAGDGVSIALKSMLRTNPATVATVHGMTGLTVTGNVNTVKTEAFAVALDPVLYVYFFEYLIENLTDVDDAVIWYADLVVNTKRVM